MQEIGNIITKIKKKNPIVFHITNLVTINDCANITLSVGASPLMSFCADELEEILSFSSCLVINIGTMEKAMQEVLLTAGKIANKLNVPIVLDPVGVGATSARKKIVSNLLNEVNFSVIKGNAAEIKSLMGLETIKAGVDSKEYFNDGAKIKELARKLQCTIAVSGQTDIISDGEKTAKITNGIPLLTKVSGTGCMSASLIGCACGANEDFFNNAIFGISLMGISAQIAQEKNPNIGNGGLKSAILDNILHIKQEDIAKKIMINIKQYQ